MKFKVGDRVKIVRTDYTVDKKYINNIVTITKIDTVGRRYFVKENDRPWIDKELNKFNFTKDDLQYGDKITLRNGSAGFYEGEDTAIHCLRYCHINDNLTNNGGLEEELDIVKVERPTYVTIYEREEQPKEMTLQEVCEELGYEVKIIEE